MFVLLLLGADELLCGLYKDLDTDFTFVALQILLLLNLGLHIA